MRTLENILESLLDNDFDIGDSDVLTLRQAGYYCTNMACTDEFGRYISSGQIKKMLGINISQTNGETHMHATD